MPDNHEALFDPPSQHSQTDKFVWPIMRNRGMPIRGGGRRGVGLTHGDTPIVEKPWFRTATGSGGVYPVLWAYCRGLRIELKQYLIPSASLLNSVALETIANSYSRKNSAVSRASVIHACTASN